MKKMFNFLGIIILVMAIGFAFTSCPEPGSGNPGDDPGVTTGGGSLSAGKWSNGYIADPQDTIRYTFKAAVGYYELLFNNRSSGDGTKTLATTYSITYEGGASGSSAIGMIVISSPGTVVITVKPSTSSIFNTGTFAIAYIAGYDSDNLAYPAFNPPSPTALKEDSWADGEIARTSDYIWYSIDVVAAQTYNLWWNDAYQGNKTMTADIAVQGFYSDGTSITGLSSNFDSAWNTARSFTPDRNGKIFIRASINLLASAASRLGTFGLVYSTGTTRPSTLNTADAVQLTLGEWTEGAISSISSVRWYSVTAESAGTHYFWWNDAGQGNGNGTVDVSVAGYRGNDTEVFNQDHGWTTSRSVSMTAGETIYLRVASKNSGETGNFSLIFATTNTRPWLQPNNTVTLTQSQWTDGEITANSNSEKWYSFDAAAGTSYRIWWDDYTEGSNTKTLNIRVYAYNSNGTQIFNQDYGWSAAQLFSPTASGKIYINVIPYNSGATGTFGIVYSTTDTRPVVPAPASSTTLTVGQWADGNISAAGGEQWFSFTATAATQYIHFGRGTLDDVNVRLFDSSMNTVGGGAANLYGTGSNSYAYRSVTAGQVYYMKVYPYYSSGYGVFRIAFNESTTAPAQ